MTATQSPRTLKSDLRRIRETLPSFFSPNCVLSANDPAFSRDLDNQRTCFLTSEQRRYWFGPQLGTQLVLFLISLFIGVVTYLVSHAEYASIRLGYALLTGTLSFILSWWYLQYKYEQRHDHKVAKLHKQGAGMFDAPSFDKDGKNLRLTSSSH